MMNQMKDDLERINKTFKLVEDFFYSERPSEALDMLETLYSEVGHALYRAGRRRKQQRTN